MLIIGHRGAKGLAPENTLASIKAALKCRVDMIEVDVRQTKDNVPILSHDSYIETGSGRLILKDRSFAELLNAKADICTLQDAIKFIKRKVPIIIEVKPGEPVEEISCIINGFLTKGWKNTDFLLESFSYKTLRALHRSLPKLNTVVAEQYFGTRAVWRAKRLGTKYICLNRTNIWSFYIRRMKKRGYKILAFTVNNPAKTKRLEEYGLAGVFTDRPDKY